MVSLRVGFRIVLPQTAVSLGDIYQNPISLIQIEKPSKLWISNLWVGSPILLRHTIERGH
jgi:hypothetical protein